MMYDVYATLTLGALYHMVWYHTLPVQHAHVRTTALGNHTIGMVRTPHRVCVVQHRYNREVHT